MEERSRSSCSISSSWRILVLLDAAEHRKDLINNFAWDEAAKIHVHILDEGHAQQGDPGLYSCENVTMSCQLMAPPLRLPARQFGPHLLDTLGMELLRGSKALVEQ